MTLREETVRKNYIYRGKIINLRCDDALLPDGKPCKREIVEHPGGAAVLCIHEGKVALVKQFRYAYGKEIYEIPAGKLEKGEDPALAAKRELEEETGYNAGELVHLADIYPTPGYTDEIIRVYQASGCTITHRHLDEGEFLNCELVPLDKVLEMIDSGEICDAKTIIAVYKYILNR